MNKIFLLTIFSILFALPVSAVSVIDSDEDGLSDEIEISLGTDANNNDSDGDGFKDGQEVKSGFSPFVGNGSRDVKRRVEVNLANQSLELYMNDVKVNEAPVSSGLKNTPTPVGDFTILRKRPVVHYKGPGYDLPNTKWNLEFKKSFYIHGAYWHNQFGIKPMSHGCVNVAYKDMESIYTFLSVGDSVKIFGKAPLKPLTLSKK